MIFRLTVGVAERLKKLGLLDVMRLTSEPEQLAALLADQQRCLDVLWEMAEQTKLGPNEFLEWFAETSPDKLFDTISGELVSFSRESMRPVIVGLLDSVKNADNETANEMVALIKSNSPSITTERPNEIGNTFGDVPGLSGSILATSLFENSTIWPSTVCDPIGSEQAA